MKRYLLLMLLLGLVGCGRAWVDPPPLSQEIRATLGTIGVRSCDSSPSVYWSTPTTGAGSGAWAGLKMLRSCNEAPCIVLVPFFALGGAIYGGVAGESSEAVANAEAVLKEASAGVLKIQDTIRDRIFETARDRTRYPVVLLQPTDQPRASEGSVQATPADAGVTTVLEVGVSRIALVEQQVGHNPPLRLGIYAEAKLMRSRDGRVFYEMLFWDWSPPREFVAWGEGNGQFFRDEVTRLSQEVADRITGKVFFSDLPPKELPPPNPTMEETPVTTAR